MGLSTITTSSGGAEPPEEESEVSLKGLKSTCFCALNARWGMLGPYWFEDTNGKMVTVNGERYRKVLHRFHANLTQLLSPNQLRLSWFMQDGAPPYTAGETIDLLHQLFRNRVISQATVHERALHSLDLNPLDFIFWGAAKGQLYANKPRTLAVLKQEVEDYCQATAPATCR